MNDRVWRMPERRWPAFEEAMRGVEAGVFDDREFDVLLDDGQRAPPATGSKRIRPRRETTMPARPGARRAAG
jgi:hypothetical protein